MSHPHVDCRHAHPSERGEFRMVCAIGASPPNSRTALCAVCPRYDDGTGGRVPRRVVIQHEGSGTQTVRQAPQRKSVSLNDLYHVCKALFTGEGVSEDRRFKRLEICSLCPYADVDPQTNKARCGICGCRVKRSGLINLARYEETDDYGCKHPDGSRWKAAGV